MKLMLTCSHIREFIKFNYQSVMKSEWHFFLVFLLLFFALSSVSLLFHNLWSDNYFYLHFFVSSSSCPLIIKWLHNMKVLCCPLHFFLSFFWFAFCSYLMYDSEYTFIFYRYYFYIKSILNFTTNYIGLYMLYFMSEHIVIDSFFFFFLSIKMRRE